MASATKLKRNRVVGICNWLLLACSAGLFLFCFAFIDVKALYKNSKELQVAFQSLSNFGASSGSTSHGSSSKEDTDISSMDVPSESPLEAPLSGATTEPTKRSRAAVIKSLAGCNISHGHWVYDETYPLYRSKDCPFMDPGFRCEENGRPDTEFMKYRWQPYDCDLPRFDPKDILRRLRNQRVVFVGDSLGRNHWESMLCVLAQGISNKSRVYETNGYPITKHVGMLSFLFEDYNFTVEYHRDPFLVPQTRPPKNAPGNVTNVLKIDEVSWSASKWWPGANLVVVNTGHWWMWDRIIVNGHGAFQEGNNLTTHGLEDAFRIAMKTWALWMEENLDPASVQVFFRSIASRHFRGGTWSGDGGRCDEEVKPLASLEEQADMLGTPWTNKHMLDAINQNMKTKRNAVEFIDITTPSNFRSDGHPGLWSDLPEGQDCSHFCLPGVPDTWNEILFASLLARGRGAWGDP